MQPSDLEETLQAAEQEEAGASPAQDIDTVLLSSDQPLHLDASAEGVSGEQHLAFSIEDEDYVTIGDLRIKCTHEAFEHCNYAVEGVTGIEDIAGDPWDDGDASVESMLAMDTDSALDAIFGQMEPPQAETIDAFLSVMSFNAEEKDLWKDKIKRYIEKMDSACSHTVSGDPGRLHDARAPDRNIGIVGFDKSRQTAELIGSNEFEHKELFVRQMPKDLVLHCMWDFAKGGAVVVTGKGGLVLKLDDDDLQSLLEWCEQKEKVVRLTVRNRTYEILRDATVSVNAATVEETDIYHIYESAFTASTYFNGKINMNTADEVILSNLLCGHTLRNLKHIVKHRTVTGLHPSVTLENLTRFERQFGRSTDPVQLALNHRAGNQAGFEVSKELIVSVGQRVGCDYFTADYNLPGTTVLKADGSTFRDPTRKLPSLGGALAFFLSVDEYSGFIQPRLVKRLSKSYLLIADLIKTYKMYGHTIQTLATDEGIINPGEYRVSDTKSMELLLENNIKFDQAEPYNHSNGLALPENAGKNIKQLKRMAITYLMTNKYVMDYFKWKPTQYLQLWGEAVHWAALVLSLRPSPGDPSVSRYQMFMNIVPNVQDIRLLPIFCVVMVLRMAGGTPYSNQTFYVYGLYAGPAQNLPAMRAISGAVRVVVMTDQGPRVIVSSKIKGISEGANLDRNAETYRGIRQLLQLSPLELDALVRQETESSTQQPAVPIVDDQAQPEADPDQGVTTERPSAIVEEVNEEETAEEEEPPELLHEKDEEDAPAKPSRGQDASPGTTRTKRAPRNILDLVQKALEQRKQEKLNASKRGVKGLRVPAKRAPDHPLDIRKVGGSYEKHYLPKSLSRTQRMKARQQGRDRKAYWADAQAEWEEEIYRNEVIEEAYFLDWSTVGRDDYYLDIERGELITVSNEPVETAYLAVNKKQDLKVMNFEKRLESMQEEEGFKAVTDGVPRNWDEALVHPLWGPPARLELEDVASKALIKVDKDIAKKLIREGVDCVTLFPVYEVKERDGKTVYKVRLVGNGRTHFTHGNTYSSVPARDELFVFVDIVATEGWTWVHLDEKRAFLKAKRNDANTILAKIQRTDDYYEVINALYGLKTSTLDHQLHVAKRLEALGYKRLGMCSSIYMKTEGNNMILMFVYVDDFFMTSNNKFLLESEVLKLRETVETTEPIWNPAKGLGMEFERDWEKKVICITMKEKIAELNELFNLDDKRVDHPLPQAKYLITQEDFDKSKFVSEKDKEPLISQQDKALYLQMVGSLLWVNGVRMDITFSTLYLTWFTHAPRHHHIGCARRVVAYLKSTEHIPLVLGGKGEKRIITITDASLGTGPKSRSVLGMVTRLTPHGGAIITKGKATVDVKLSSFNGEIGGMFEGVKVGARVRNILEEFNQFHKYNPVRLLINDNEKAVDFMNSNGPGTGMRHAELRFFYIREVILKKEVECVWNRGVDLVADPVTKCKGGEAMRAFTYDIQGLELLE